MGDGSAARPFREISDAITAVVGGGTVYLHEGVHRPAQSVLVEQTHSGTKERHLVIRAFPGEHPVVDGSLMTGAPEARRDGFAVSADWVDIVELELTSTVGNAAIGVWGGSNVRVIGNRIHDTARNGISIVGSAKDVNGRSRSILVQANVLEHIYTENSGANLGKSNWGQAIQCGFVDDISVTDNRVQRAGGEGIGLYVVDSARVLRNVVIDSFSVGVYLDNARHVSVESNLIMSTGDSGYYRNGNPLNAIQMANESYPTVYDRTPYHVGDATIVNNVVVGAGAGVYYGTYAGYGNTGVNQPGLSNVLIAYNTFWNPMEFIRMDDDPNHRNVRFVNNVFSRDRNIQSANWLPSSLPGVAFERNYWQGGDPTVARAADDVAGKLVLPAAGSFLLKDYRPTADSTIAAKARGLAAVTVDAVGVSRSARSAPTLGALEPQ